MAHPMDGLERMADAWDRMSADYGERLGLSPGDAHYLALARCVPETRAAVRILDIGCGPGYELDAILARVPAAVVTCMDVSRRMLDALARRLSRVSARIETRHGSYVDAGLGSRVFDFVISSLTVHHLPGHTKLALFRRIRAALRTGGAYLELDDVCGPGQERVGRQWYEEYVARLDGGERGEWNHNMPFTIASEKALLEEAGFSPVGVPWSDVDAEGRGRAVFAAGKGGE